MSRYTLLAVALFSLFLTTGAVLHDPSTDDKICRVAKVSVLVMADVSVGSGTPRRSLEIIGLTGSVRVRDGELTVELLGHKDCSAAPNSRAQVPPPLEVRIYGRTEAPRARSVQVPATLAISQHAAPIDLNVLVSDAGNSCLSRGVFPPALRRANST